MWCFQRRWPGARFWIGVDPPHHGSVAVTFPRILNQRLSLSAVELFVLVNCHSEADVDIWTATMASTTFQLDEKVADLPYRRGPDSHRVRLWRGGSASSLFFFLFFYSFVEYVDIDTSTYFKAPGPYCGAEGRWRIVGLTVSASVRAVLSVCSLLLRMFLPCRLIIDPAGSVGPRGTGCDSDWKLVLPQPVDTQPGGTPSVCSCISLTA